MTDGLDSGEMGDASSFETLLQVLEAMPGVEAAWDLDCLRTALRVARATEAPGDVERARLAYRALSPAGRARLLAHLTAVARQQSGRPAPTLRPAQRSPGRWAAFVAALTGGPAADSGTTARERLLRDRRGIPS